jgi:sugar/nucleoside kinase (ribokinase family)
VALLGIIGNISRDFITHADGRRTETTGGAALYIALATARAGHPAAPVSVVGTDLAWITTSPELQSLDLTNVKVTQGQSCAFTITYDHAGHLTGVRSRFGAADDLTEHALPLLSSIAVWHVCCRRPLDAAAILSRLIVIGARFSVDFHLPSANTQMLAAADALPHAEAVFVNAAEYTILTRIIDPARLSTLIVSDGPRPATVLRRGQPIASSAPPAVRVADATGAGDTLTGTYLAATAHGLPAQDALDRAVTAAAESVTRSVLPLVPGGD